MYVRVYYTLKGSQMAIAYRLDVISVISQGPKNSRFPGPNPLPLGLVMDLHASKSLKVPKREIVDHSDFHDFYAIKSLTVSDFGVKKKICLKNI